MSLKFIAISGTTGVTQNHYIYEYGNDMIVVDCGVGFPESDMYGVDLVIPDFSYVLENVKKLRGILISHGHEDHMGALPFLLAKVDVPVYATKLVAGFIEDKLSEHRMKDKKIRVFDPDKETISLGNFKVTPFRVSHSVPDGVGFAIDTPEGKVFHVADYKFDWTPVDGRPFDIAKAASLASGGVLALASDCIGSTSQGYTESEKEIEERIEEIVRNAPNQVFFSTISSNISRMQQALNVSHRLGRKACFVGRSIDKKSQIAKRLGYMNYPSELIVTPREATRLPRNKVMYIISGSYGQPGSALYRVANNEHEFLKVEDGDVVVFSSDPAPPGSKANVDFVVDKLTELKADVHYYDIQEDLHVSGHGSQKDIEMLFALVSPKYFIPLGGTIRHMRAYSLLAQSMGVNPKNVFEMSSGEVLEFKGSEAGISGKLNVKDVLVDGLGIGDVGNVVLRDRQILATDGVAIALIHIDRQQGSLILSPEIISRGFVYEGKSKDLLINGQEELLRNLKRVKRIDPMVARNITIDFLEKYFFEKTGRRPMILPLIVEV